jgi:hypothetical protein
VTFDEEEGKEAEREVGAWHGVGIVKCEDRPQGTTKGTSSLVMLRILEQVLFALRAPYSNAGALSVGARTCCTPYL